MKWIFSLFICIFASKGFTLMQTDEIQECIYIAPKANFLSDVFSAMVTKGEDPAETFSSMAAYLHEIKDSCHQFYFKYPLQNAEQAEIFSKVMQIKAQEAHRFVPVIVDSKFIEPRNLGFSRKIGILDGPSIQEHVLMDPTSHSIIFIEESITLQTGETLPGAFMALNRLMEEDGTWYFSGIYLFDTVPTEQETQERVEMFRLTFENMIHFTENNDVTEAYSQLKEY